MPKKDRLALNFKIMSKQKPTAEAIEKELEEFLKEKSIITRIVVQVDNKGYWCADISLPELLKQYATQQCAIVSAEKDKEIAQLSSEVDFSVKSIERKKKLIADYETQLQAKEAECQILLKALEDISNESIMGPNSQGYKRLKHIARIALSSRR